jgi:hypothetical protein
LTVGISVTVWKGLSVTVLTDSCLLSASPWRDKGGMLSTCVVSSVLAGELRASSSVVSPTENLACDGVNDAFVLRGMPCRDGDVGADTDGAVLRALAAVMAAVSES